MIQNINTKEMKYLAIYVDLNDVDRRISLYDTTTTNPIMLMKEVTKAFGATNLSMLRENSLQQETVHMYQGCYMMFYDIDMGCDEVNGHVVIIDASMLPEEFIVCSDRQGLTFIGTEDKCPVALRGIRVYNENPVFKYESL